jgi:hypothetical protein
MVLTDAEPPNRLAPLTPPSAVTPGQSASPQSGAPSRGLFLLGNIR